MSSTDGIGRRHRLAAAIMGLALVAGAGACGSGDDGGDSATAGASGSAESEPALSKQSAGVLADAKAGTPQGEIANLYMRHIGALYANDFKTVCVTMSRAARAEISGKGTCEEWFQNMLKDGKLSPNRPYIVKLDVRGATAKAMVRTRNSNSYPLIFAKEGGEWRMTAK